MMAIQLAKFRQGIPYNKPIMCIVGYLFFSGISAVSVSSSTFISF
jgi:hypothetical protein